MKGFGRLNIAKDSKGRGLNAQAIEPATFGGMINEMKEADGLGSIFSKKKDTETLIEKIKKKKI